MATQTITAMFDNYDDAAKAVGKLESAGVPHANISIVSNDTATRGTYAERPYATSGTGQDNDATEKGTGTGASVGTVLGGGAGLLAGFGMLAIPGLGPVVAAGWLASTLVGAGAGAATGGIIGALTGAGVDETHAHSYAEGINRGGTLVTVRTEQDMASDVTDILDDDGTVDMGARESSWRTEGWSGTYSGADQASSGTLGGTTGAAGTTGATGSIGSGRDAAGIDRPGSLGEMGTRGRVGTYPSGTLG